MNPELTDRGWEINFDGVLQAEDEPAYATKQACEAAIREIASHPGFDRSYALGCDYACGIYD